MACRWEWMLAGRPRGLRAGLCRQRGSPPTVTDSAPCSTYVPSGYSRVLQFLTPHMENPEIPYTYKLM